MSRSIRRSVEAPSSLFRFHTTRRASTTAIAAADDQDLEPLSSFDAAPDLNTTYDPISRSKSRTSPLPSSRYKFRPPKYYRGPLHPHQPPKPSDPASREYIPGPFSLPRLAQTYDTTIAPDLMTLAYQHYPPGYEAPTKAPRLRSWDGSSPYHKNRPLRGPRGGDTLRLIRKPITFRNIPRLDGVVVHSFVQEATKGREPLDVASMAIQAITGVSVQLRQARHNVVQWGMRAGKRVAVVSELKGEDMYHFLSKLVDVVMPKMKDWRGIKGSSGDTSGNITFGMRPEEVAYFPEIEFNYDSYPTRLIPGCHITIKTTAADDRDARLLLTALGIPFWGKQIN